MSFKTSRFLRSAELLKTAAKIGARELLSSSPSSRIAQAKAIVESLSQLKGAAMKAGQLLSLELDDYFPPEAIEILSVLQKAADPHPFSDINAVVNKELSKEQREKIKFLNEKPMASASIGQIHRAKVDGKDVVLKIQYAGVENSIDSDLKILKNLFKSLAALTGRKMDLDPMFAEFKSVLEDEVNFLKEMAYLQKYKTRAGELGKAFHLPTVYPDLSTKKVLTMSFEEGLSLKDWLVTKPSLKKREELAHLMLNLFVHEFFKWGLVQTDPNFGNFLIRDEGENIILVLLDFGATKEYSPQLISDYQKFLKSVETFQAQTVIQEAIRFGLIDPRESSETQGALLELIFLAAQPIKNPGAFEFNDKEFLVKAQDIGRRFTAGLKYSAPPHKIMFLHRKLGGLYSFLKKLDVAIDIGPYWDQATRKN
jgi:aarF domain-containing kinase